MSRSYQEYDTAIFDNQTYPIVCRQLTGMDPPKIPGLTPASGASAGKPAAASEDNAAAKPKAKPAAKPAAAPS